MNLGQGFGSSPPFLSLHLVLLIERGPWISVRQTSDLVHFTFVLRIRHLVSQSLIHTLQTRYGLVNSKLVGIPGYRRRELYDILLTNVPLPGFG